MLPYLLLFFCGGGGGDIYNNNMMMIILVVVVVEGVEGQQKKKNINRTSNQLQYLSSRSTSIITIPKLSGTRRKGSTQLWKKRLNANPVELRCREPLVVYPALLLFTTGMFASSISFRYALQDTICYRLHKELKPVPMHGGNSTSANIDCEKDKDVIASTAQWNGVLVTALGLTSCITSGTVAALTDRYGRRLILGLAAFGQTINAVVVLLCLVYNLSPYYFVIGYALNGLTGGYPAFLACAFAYIADLSAKQDRPVLFGGGESMLFLGGVIGPVAIGYIVKSISSLRCSVRSGMHKCCPCTLHIPHTEESTNNEINTKQREQPPYREPKFIGFANIL